MLFNKPNNCVEKVLSCSNAISRELVAFFQLSSAILTVVKLVFALR